VRLLEEGVAGLEEVKGCDGVDLESFGQLVCGEGDSFSVPVA
jgi:hypothetical protein